MEGRAFRLEVSSLQSNADIHSEGSKMTLTSCNTCHTHLAFSTPHAVITADWFLGTCLHNPANINFLICKWQTVTSMRMTSYQHQYSGQTSRKTCSIHMCIYQFHF